MKIKASKAITVLELLGYLSPDSSKNTRRNWLKQGRVSLDGKMIVKPNAIVREGQTIELGKRIAFVEELKILYEDDHIVVVDKPEGLLSVATDFEKHCAHRLLKRKYHHRRVFPVHRLDREVSGILLFAYTEQARDHLKEQFYRHSIEREYQAIVEGHLQQSKGMWRSHLVEDETYYVSSHATKGQLAITQYEVIQYERLCTRLKLTLETGRKNQLRVHCKESGHPIFGDKKYGANHPKAPRLCLHATRLKFIHPHLEKTFSFTSLVPF
jgi:23S rRNA pseudouridine1911/1915/1917 synthase